MNFNIKERTIYFVRHGSYCYGTNTPTSDIDYKGVCIPPRSYYLGFTQNFEQYEHMGSKSDGVDEVIYSLNKFAKLAADCNPSIIEVLYVADEDIVEIDEFGEELRSIRDEFLSKKARYTFAGYMMSQVKRIKTHRSWLLNPPKSMPNRKDFSLPESTKVSQSELGAFDAAVKEGIEIELPKDVLTLFMREKQYQTAKTHWDQYVNWQKSRNPARAELEAKFGYDVKYAYHVIRLGRMGCEILEQHKVIVKRPDREELLRIRNGAWSYDQLLEEAEKLDARAAELYETSSLRKSPDRNLLDEHVIFIVERYLNLNG